MEDINENKTFKNYYSSLFGDTPKHYLYNSGLMAFGLSSIYLMSRYKICNVNEYLIRTGLGIKNIKVSKSGLVLPLIHKSKIIDISPKLYIYNNINNISRKSNIQYNLPIKLFVGPKHPENDIYGFTKYIELLSNNDDYLNEIINYIVEKNTSILVSNLDINDIFQNKNEVKQNIINYISLDFSSIGLDVYNGNIGIPNNITPLLQQTQYNNFQNRNNIDEIIKYRDNIEVTNNEYDNSIEKSFHIRNL